MVLLAADDTTVLFSSAHNRHDGVLASCLQMQLYSNYTLPHLCMQMTDEHMDSILSTNFKSVAFAFKYQLPAIEKSGGKGSVLVTSSGAGIRATANAFTGFEVYAASKAAVNMLTQYAVSLSHGNGPPQLALLFTTTTGCSAAATALCFEVLRRTCLQAMQSIALRHWPNTERLTPLRCVHLLIITAGRTSS
jgi:short chain dehydrogenase